MGGSVVDSCFLLESPSFFTSHFPLAPTQMEKFEVIRNQNEHEENEMHKLCGLYRHYIENGIPPKDARKYIKWIYKYQMRGENE